MTDDPIEASATFEVAASPAEAWKALESLRAEADAPDRWWVPGFECRGEELVAEPGRHLSVRKLDEPCAGTTIAITFEHLATGSRIRVVQSGFDAAFVAGAGEGFWVHARHLFADVHLFFELGVRAERAWAPWAPLGVGVEERAFGLEVTRVRSSAWGGRLGLTAGDVLLTIAGAPLYRSEDLGLLERVLAVGQDVNATWVHDGERRAGSATV